MVTGHQSDFQTSPDLLPPRVPAMAACILFTCCVGSKPTPSRTRDRSPQPWHLWQLHQGRRGWSRQLGWAGASAEAAVGNRPEPWVRLVGFLCLFQGVNTRAHILLEGSLNFLQSSCEAHWFSNPDKGAHLPGFEPQRWGAQCTVQTSYSPGRIFESLTSPSSCVPSLGHRFQPDCISALPLRLCVIFLYRLGHR